MTYKEMFDFLASKGVQVNFEGSTDCYGEKPAEGEEFLQCWMVRTREHEDGPFYFCCGFDLIGNGKVWISGKEYPVDETIFDNLMGVIRRQIWISPSNIPFPEDVLLVVDYDYYYGKTAYAHS